MSTLFLIGNGFDLNCGMKTSYKDVYKMYIKEPPATKCISEFKSMLSENIDSWGDFEMSMAGYAAYMKSEDDFLECVRDFASYMEGYLVNEKNKFREIIHEEKLHTEVMKEIEDSLSNFYKGITHNVDRVIDNRASEFIAEMCAITFNYTDIFDTFFYRYLGVHAYHGEKIVHIHGRLGDDPVFGVDNIEQIKAEFQLSRKGKRGFVKPVFNEQYDQHRVEQAKNMINNANVICTYGMSLGESDLTWRNEIIKWLHSSEKNHLFVYMYALCNIENKTTSERMDREEDEKEKLLDEWGIDDKDAIVDRIHIPCGKNIFNIKKIILDALKVKNQRLIEEGEKFVEEHMNEMLVV